MSACSMPPADQMQFFEDYVNSDRAPVPPPKFPNEVLEFRLPQRAHPMMLSKRERRAQARYFDVFVLFVALYCVDEVQSNSRQRLKWKYHDVRIVEMV